MTDPNRFPHLSGPIVWGPVTNRFVTGSSFDESLVSNVTMVPTAGGFYAMMRLADGRWEIPGGTLEPGEHWRDALRRELMEEFGAEQVESVDLADEEEAYRRFQSIGRPELGELYRFADCTRGTPSDRFQSNHDARFR